MAVPVRQGVLNDPSRPNWDGDGPRPISWVLWYPAESGEKLPLILLSHGTGGAVRGMAWFGEAMAQAGYAVLGVNHHGNTAVEPYRAEGFLCWWERPRDLTFALDHHLSDGPLAGRIDEHRLFAAGFSLGGYTVVSLAGGLSDMDRFRAAAAEKAGGLSGPKEFPDSGDHIDRLLKDSGPFRDSWARAGDDYRDRRVSRFFAMAPAPPIWAFSDDSLAAIRYPVSIFTGENDREAPYESCSVWLEERLRNSSLENAGAEIGHYVFLNAVDPAMIAANPDVYQDPPGVDRKEVQARAIAIAEGFFA